MANKKYNGPKLENGLYYSDEEICSMYKEASDKKEQIHILMELNLCNEEKIRQALIRSGIDGRTLPRRSKKKDTSGVDESTQEKIDNNILENNSAIKVNPTDKSINSNSDDCQTLINQIKLASHALVSYQESLLSKKENLTKEIQSLEITLKDLQTELAECDANLAICKVLLS